MYLRRSILKGSIKNRKSRETGNLGYTRRRKLKQKTKTKHKNVIILKTRALLCGNRNGAMKKNNNYH
jgi:hypothetical protein